MYTAQNKWLVTHYEHSALRTYFLISMKLHVAQLVTCSLRALSLLSRRLPALERRQTDRNLSMPGSSLKC